MTMDAGLMRALVLGVVLVLLYGSRLTKGSVRETPEGMAFGLKPIFAWSRAIALPAYVLFFVYMLMVKHQQVPWWMALLFVAAIALGLAQMPGTIVLTPDAVTQRFWLQKSKRIEYGQVMAVQAMAGGRTTWVLGDNRVKISHTGNHCASEEFRAEIQRRTGKRLVG